MSTFSRLPSLPLRIILNAIDCADVGAFTTFEEGIAVCFLSSAVFLFTLTLPTPKNFSISRSNSDCSSRDATKFPCALRPLLLPILKIRTHPRSSLRRRRRRRRRRRLLIETVFVVIAPFVVIVLVGFIRRRGGTRR